MSAVKREAPSDDDDSADDDYQYDPFGGDDMPPPKTEHSGVLPPPKRTAPSYDSDDDDASSSSASEAPAPPVRRSARVPLPMPHGAGMAMSLDAGVAMRPVYHPMWTELFDDLGERPVGRKDCWGCNFGKIGVAVGLPYEGFTKLSRELPNKLDEVGLYAAAKWANDIYRTEVYDKLIASDDVRRQCVWSGISILWHFAKHANIDELRIRFETFELQHTVDWLQTRELHVLPQFGDPLADVTVDLGTIKRLTPLRGMLSQLRKAVPKGSASKFNNGQGRAAGVPYTEMRFTGSGALHD